MIDRRTLKFRVGAALAGMALLVWILGGLVTVWITRVETEEILDGHLKQVARLVASLPSEEFEEYEHAASPLGGEVTIYDPRIAVLIWNRDGKLLFKSDGAPLMGRPDAAVDAAPHAVVVDGREWRASAVLSWRTDHVVQAMARQDLGRPYLVHVGESFARTSIFLVPLTVLLVWFALNRSMRHIERLRLLVASRDPLSVSPIPNDEAPTELAGLIEAINGLAARHSVALKEIQRFTADAAHELRTPLAAIHTHAQVALAESNDEWRRMSLEQIEAVAARTGRLLDQLLKLARLNHADLDFTRERCNLADLVRPIAVADEAIEWRAEDASVEIVGVPSLVDLAVRNLVSNARKHGGGKVLMEIGSGTLERDGRPETWVAVEDEGAGIPESFRDKVFDAFFRIPGARLDGSGLGLSIVRRVAMVHQARVYIEPARHLRGARFVFAFRALPA